MNDDPLAEFRREGAATPPLAARRTSSAGDRRPYEAFSSRDSQRPARLNIRRKGGMSHAPAYNFIVDVCYDDERYAEILLALSNMLVKIEGRNLKPVADALVLGTCRFVQEFRDDLFDRPRDEAAPFIETIKTITAGAPAAQA